MKLRNMLLSLSVLSGILLLAQNCGRVSVQDSMLSLPLAMTVDLEPNSTKSFTVEARDGSAQVAKLSFDAQSEKLNSTTDKNNAVAIDNSTKSVSFTPTSGFQGNDQIVVYAYGIDGVANAVLVTFIVKATGLNLPTTSALVYGKNDRAVLQNKFSGYAPPGMADV